MPALVAACLSRAASMRSCVLFATIASSSASSSAAFSLASACSSLFLSLPLLLSLTDLRTHQPCYTLQTSLQGINWWCRMLQETARIIQGQEPLFGNFLLGLPRSCSCCTDDKLTTTVFHLAGLLSLMAVKLLHSVSCTVNLLIYAIALVHTEWHTRDIRSVESSHRQCCSTQSHCPSINWSTDSQPFSSFANSTDHW